MVFEKIEKSYFYDYTQSTNLSELYGRNPNYFFVLTPTESGSNEILDMKEAHLHIDVGLLVKDSAFFDPKYDLYMVTRDVLYDNTTDCGRGMKLS